MYKHFLKRIIDIIFALISLPILLIIFFFIGPIIYLTDRDSIFYVSERIGKNGKLFKMYKFRTMKVNAPDIRLADGSTYNSENDPRVTEIGKFLRKTSIDEVPQILNVLFGHMSFIGPRPDPPDWLERYPENVKIFLSVKPGITGYNQAYFRNSTNGKEKMKNDVLYAIQCSFIFDLKILLKTIAVVLKKENTYKIILNEDIKEIAEIERGLKVKN
jgi:undecaprenyl phosphate N,N'-diacetylbacillosamine 1-phosphate transferase